jgi:secondary thiamine-phosphate synthase enzyme
LPRPREIRLRTDRRTQLVDISGKVQDAVAGGEGSAVLVYVPHTTAGVTINEHADPAVARDHETALERIVGDEWAWQHHEPGEDNAPTHVRASLLGPSVVVPLRDDGTLALGTWQGVFFCEFDGPRDRTVYVTVLR